MYNDFDCIQNIDLPKIDMSFKLNGQVKILSVLERPQEGVNKLAARVEKYDSFISSPNCTMYSTKATATTWNKHDNQSSYAVAVVPLVHWPMYLDVPNKRPVINYLPLKVISPNFD